MKSSKPIYVYTSTSLIKKNVSLSLILGILVVCGLSFLSWNGHWIRIQGSEMEPNWKEGQWAWLEKTKEASTIGQVVIIRDNQGQLRIRRLIGKSMDSIAYRKGRVWRNGRWTSSLKQKDFLDPLLAFNQPILIEEKVKDDSYLVYVPSFKKKGILELNPVQLQEHEVFVLCDHRLICQDPFVIIHKNQIVGILSPSSLFN